MVKHKIETCDLLVTANARRQCVTQLGIKSSSLTSFDRNGVYIDNAHRYIQTAGDRARKVTTSAANIDDHGWRQVMATKADEVGELVRDKRIMIEGFGLCR
jgi:hypothetical protein